MAHSPLACHCMEKSFQESVETLQLFAALRSLRARMEGVFEEAKKQDEKIKEIKKEVMNIVAFQTEQIKENL